MDTQSTISPSLGAFLHVVFKRKLQILLFFGTAVCTVGIATFMAQPTYQAAAQILVKIGRENLYVPTVPTSGNVNPVYNFHREEQINSEIEILRGRFLAEKVVETLGPTVIYPDLKDGADAQLSPAKKAIMAVQKSLEVEGVRKSDVINVSFKHKDPQMAASLVNTLVNLYLDHHLQVHKSPGAYKFFQEQSQILKDKLRQTDEDLEAFKQQHGVTSIEEQRTLFLRHEANLRTALNQTLSQEAETENRIRQLRQQLASTSKTIPLDEEVDHNPLAINTLQARLVELELKEQDLLNKYTEQSRLVRNIRGEIQVVRDKLAEQEAKRYQGKSRVGVNPNYQRLQTEVFQNEAELKALDAKKETQKAQLVEYQKKLARLNGVEVELNRLEQEVEVARQNYKLYQTKFEESRISDAMDTEKIANVSIIEPARPPVKPVSPKRRLNMLLSIFLGAFGGLGLAFCFEYLDDTLEKTEDVERYLDLPVLATIPELKG